jgi:Fic family protein
MDSAGRYTETHPWITFELNMKKAHPRVWILIGKAMNGCGKLRESAADPAVAERIRRSRLLEAVRAAAVMEGISLSSAEIEELLEISPEGIGESIAGGAGSEADKVYVINLVRLYRFMLEQISGLRESRDITADGIAGINGILYRGIELEQGKSPGSFRASGIREEGYRGVPYSECSELVSRLTRGIAESRASFPAGDEVASGLIRAFIAHRYLTWILPFDAGNAQTARFAELQVMLSAGVPEAAALCMSGYYERTHAEYRNLLFGERKDSIFDFMEYCLRGFVRKLSRICSEVEHSRVEAVWSGFLDGAFAGEREEIAHRRKMLALGLRAIGEPVSPSRLRYASAEVTLCYEGMSDKTLTRDVNSLIELGILERSGRMVGVREEVIFPFRDNH